MARHKATARRLLVWGGLAAMLCGCPLTQEEADAGPGACAGSLVTVSGQWTISGEGERTGCTDSTLEASFTLGPSQPLAVTQAEADDGGVAAVGLAAPLGGFELDGTVEGRCVSFTTNEQLPQTGAVTYSFHGSYETGPRLIGTFTGQGPGTCVANGTFAVDID